MRHFRPGVVLGAALLLCTLLPAGEARAAAEVHRLSLMLSGIPSQVNGGDFNESIDEYNTTHLDPRGYERIQHLQFAWAYDAELRYFVRQNFAVTAGLAQLRVAQRKEFLPALSQAINVRAEILTVPVHIGGAYYLQPYNQGDFQARAYFGAGLVSYAFSKATFEQVLTNPDSVLNAQMGGSFKAVLTQDAPGFYAEGGAHMFFASRWSVMVGAIYRTGQLRNALLSAYEINGTRLDIPPPGVPVNNPKGRPLMIDVGGLGAKMTIGFGF